MTRFIGRWLEIFLGNVPLGGREEFPWRKVPLTNLAMSNRGEKLGLPTGLTLGNMGEKMRMSVG